MAPERTKDTRKASRTPGRKSRKPSHEMVQCDVCLEWFAGDLERHQRVHTNTFDLWCPYEGCHKSEAPGHTGFNQLSNREDHIKFIHEKQKLACPHYWICGGVVYPCTELLAGKSCLHKHRMRVHGYCSGDSEAKVAIPTTCTRKKRHSHQFDEQAMLRFTASLGCAPVPGPSTHKKARKTKRTRKEQREDAIPSASSSSQISSYPSTVAEPYEWAGIQQTAQDFGTLPPPEPLDATCVGAVSTPMSSDQSRHDQLDFGVPPASTSYGSFDVDTFLNNALNLVNRVDYASVCDPNFLDPTMLLPDDASYLAALFPTVPNFVHSNGFPTVPGSDSNSVEQAQAVAPPQHFRGGEMDMAHRSYMPSPSRNESASPSDSVYENEWTEGAFCPFNPAFVS